MSDRPPPVQTTTEARQGRTTGVVRWVRGDLPGTRDHRHDRRVLGLVGPCADVIPISLTWTTRTAKFLEFCKPLMKFHSPENVAAGKPL